MLFPEVDSTEAITKETVSFVRNNVPDNTEVGFSGGKDSICTAKIMELSGVKHHLVYAFTGIEPPEVVRFIRNHYPQCQIRVPKRTFWSSLTVHVPPSDRLRWCCTLLKKDGHDSVLGIRSEEGAKRANRPRVNHWKGRITYHPILYWKEWQVWDFITENNLPYPKLYDEGFDRLGCIVCPYHSEKTGKLHEMYRKRWPFMFKRFEREIAKLYHKRVGQGKTMAYDSPEEFIEAWYLDDSSRWYAKEYKDDLFIHGEYLGLSGTASNKIN